MRKGAKTCSEKMVQAINWLQKFAEDCGDHPPDSKYDKRILPACYTKLSVFETYYEEKKSEIKITYASFSTMWKKYCSNISISQVNIFIQVHIFISCQNFEINRNNMQIINFVPAYI